MVDLLPELQEASLNGIEGLGYAEVYAHVDESTFCRGVIVFDRDEDLSSLSGVGSKGAVFTGPVYRGEQVSVETFPVKIIWLSEEMHIDPGATFQAVL